MSGITRRPAFWLAFALLSVISGMFAWHYFPQALPLVNLDVKMTRDDALAQAAVVADKLKLAAPDARSAALFAHDGTTQNFVELEGGGKAAFTSLLSGELYAPYWWEVRLFKPGETAEARVRFRPDGSRYGFDRKLPESEPGAALDAIAARAIAEEHARADWDIDFAPYKLLEQSQERRPSGRVDHTFVYEREREKLGEGRFRLRLTVSGDVLTGLTHGVHVPEAFQRRFQQMRSANNTIARVASLAAGAFYGVGGCIVGALWLLRRRALTGRPAFLAGVIVAGLNALALLANAPSAWFGFDTAQSTAVFWGQQIGQTMLVLVAGSLALGLVFMVAESWSRLAFPSHPQLWRLWSREAAPTLAVLGRTVGGYLCVTIELALVAAFYFVTNRYFGWWQPSETLTDPNILGSAVPALAPIAMALQAGFTEEALFRAVPLSIAALIGERLGHRRLALGVALVLEALIFSAAHANYPGFPAYSRLLELFVPAFIWGLIFLRFGLLPTVILHALFDLTLMSIPVFLIRGPGSGANQALVVAAGLLPLAIVLVRGAIAGRWSTLPAALRNGGWQAAAVAEEAVRVLPRAAAGVWTTRMQRLLPGLGALGLLAIAFGADFHSDAPPLRINREAAERVADSALKDRGVTLVPEWRQFAVVGVASGDASSWLWHKFVWREGGPGVYAKLIGNWLAPPLWEVRYARLDGGDVADRAEEWRVNVEGDGRVRGVRHQLPERRPGARLSREDARGLAQQEMRRRFGLDPAALRQVSAEENDPGARTDWRFTYADPRVDAGHGGEVRVFVVVAGDEIAGSGRYVHVPEAWERAERERDGRLALAKMGFAVVGLIAVIVALLSVIAAWNRGQFDRRAFWLAAATVLIGALISAVNQWPAFAMRLSTAEPIATQIGVYVGGIAFAIVVIALFAGLLAGVAASAARSHVQPGLSATRLWLNGAAAGLVATGVDALLDGLMPDMAPTWPMFKSENTWLPWLDPVTTTLAGGVTAIAAAIVIFHWLERFTAGWTRRRALAFAVLVLAEATIGAFKADQWMTVVAVALIGGAVATLLFATVLRFDLRAVPAFVAVNMVTDFAASGLLKGTPVGTMLAAIAIATMLCLTWAVTRYLLRPEPGRAAARGSGAATASLSNTE